MGLEAVLFDFDGLLVDTETAAFESWRGVFTDHGHVLTAAEWLPNVGANPEPFDPRARLEELVGAALAWEVIDRRRRAFRRERCQPRDGARDLVVEAAAWGLRTGLVSNSDRAWIDENLEATGLDLSFDVVVCWDDGLDPKPSPAPYLAALDQLGVAARSAIAFEDSPSGVAAATAAGIECVMVPNAMTSLADPAAADLVVASLADIVLTDLIARPDRS
jgi:HAD superfamily hydrolase (TIGR01509 family)